MCNVFLFCLSIILFVNKKSSLHATAKRINTMWYGYNENNLKTVINLLLKNNFDIIKNIINYFNIIIFIQLNNVITYAKSIFLAQSD